MSEMTGYLFQNFYVDNRKTIGMFLALISTELNGSPHIGWEVAPFNKVDAPLVDGKTGQVLTIANDYGMTAWADPTVAVEDVQVNGTSILENKVANIPVATQNEPGVVKVLNGDNVNGIKMAGGILVTVPSTSENIKNGIASNKPLVPLRQHESTFYGLAKAAGDTTQSQSSNAVGTYTLEAKTAIQTMLGLNNKIEAPATAGTSGQVLTSDGHGGQTWEDPSGGVTDVQVNGTSVLNSETGVANIPKASDSSFGVVKISTSYGVQLYGSGDNIVPGVVVATDAQIKAGSSVYRVIRPSEQHKSIFYGLAKAAGDTTQSSSSNPVGAYTEDAKLAIRNMIDATGESATITVSGTEPVISAVSNARYVCGELTSLSFTPSATGICDVIFSSGTTATVLNLPNTVILPDWFEVETNHTYEISIVDGVYGAVMVW